MKFKEFVCQICGRIYTFKEGGKCFCSQCRSMYIYNGGTYYGARPYKDVSVEERKRQIAAEKPPVIGNAYAYSRRVIDREGAEVTLKTMRPQMVFDRDMIGM